LYDTVVARSDTIPKYGGRRPAENQGSGTPGFSWFLLSSPLVTGQGRYGAPFIKSSHPHLEEANRAKARAPLYFKLLQPGDPEPEESEENVTYVRLVEAGAQPGGGKIATDIST
jgi:hypothetical protein